MTVTESETVLRNRFGEEKKDEDDHSVEVLVEKLDRFLSSIEARLRKFERFFQWKNEELKAAQKLGQGNYGQSLEAERSSSPLNPSSRRNSGASLSSIKNYSVQNLNQIHQRLKVIKASVLKSSVTNLDSLYKTLDDQYNYLFLSGNPFTSLGPPESNKENISQKIITTMQYFDEKLLQIDDYMQSSYPKAKIDYDQDSKLAPFKFYNFNRALKNSRNRYLHYYELPLSWRENRYIVYGYRFSLKHSDMVRSVFQFNHNETMNVWTHLIGVIVLLYISFIHFPLTQVFKQDTIKDNLVMYSFLGAAMQCLLGSVVWHTYSCFAKLRIRSSCACVDYTGITVLITFSIFATEYCTLYHHTNLVRVLMVFSSISGLAGLFFNWSPYFDKPECRQFRIVFFMGLAFLGVVTFLCVCFYQGTLNAFKLYSPMVTRSFLWYCGGVVFYSRLIPEKWRLDVILPESNESGGNVDHDDGFHHSGLEELKDIKLEMGDSEITSEAIKKAEHKMIVERHFPTEIKTTPEKNNFGSLWWVDYVFSSHNIWHICVVLGVVGNYSALLEMFSNMH